MSFFWITTSCQNGEMLSRAFPSETRPAWHGPEPGYFSSGLSAAEIGPADEHKAGLPFAEVSRVARAGDVRGLNGGDSTGPPRTPKFKGPSKPAGSLPL